MKSLRDATILLGLLLLLTSVKIAPVDGDATVMPVTRAGLAPINGPADTAPQPAFDAAPAAETVPELERIDVDVTAQADCNGSLIVIRRQAGGERQVWHLRADGSRVRVEPGLPPAPPRPPAALTACDKG